MPSVEEPASSFHNEQILPSPSQNIYHQQPRKSSQALVKPPQVGSSDNNQQNALEKFRQDSLNQFQQISLDQSQTSQPASSNQSCRGSLDQPDQGRASLSKSNQPSFDQSQQAFSSSPDYPQPLITVTVNPMEQNEVTFQPPSPYCNTTEESLNDRRLSIGSASSLTKDLEEKKHGLKLSSYGVRRVSDISHIHQLRKEISGLSHLASEFYTVTKSDDPDNISLDR